jgi:hypothetical protein
MRLSTKKPAASRGDNESVTGDGTTLKNAPVPDGKRGWSQTQAIMGKQFLNLIKYATGR